MYVKKIIVAIVAITLVVLAWLNLFHHINDNTITTTVKDLSSVFVVVEINEQPKIDYPHNLVTFGYLRYLLIDK